MTNWSMYDTKMGRLHYRKKKNTSCLYTLRHSSVCGDPASGSSGSTCSQGHKIQRLSLACGLLDDPDNPTGEANQVKGKNEETLEK